MKLSTMALLLHCSRAVLILGDDLDTNEVALYSDVVAAGEQEEVKKQSKVAKVDKCAKFNQ